MEKSIGRLSRMPWVEAGVLGFGKMAADCMRILLDRGIAVKFAFETEEQPFSPLQALCRKSGVPYERPSHVNTTDLLDRICRPAVVFSVNNNYLFPPQIVNKENLRIINFHNAVLPGYPGHGVIIPPWIIFNAEKRHGVSWHLVSEHLDAGRVLCCETFDVLPSDTAITLMMRCVQQGTALFVRSLECFFEADSMDESLENRAQNVYNHPNRFQMRRKRDLPNGGILDLSWDFEKCCRFLRSMDYGPIRLLREARILIEDKLYHIKRYRIDETPSRGAAAGIDELRLRFESGTIMLTIQRVERHG